MIFENSMSLSSSLKESNQKNPEPKKHGQTASQKV